MNDKSMGEVIASLRKEKKMTQNDLAKKMNVTDKAVSKWERNLSCPDINSIPKLATILDTTVDELLNAQVKKEHQKIDDLFDLILIGVSLAMGICVIVTSLFNQIELNNTILLLSIAITCLALYLLKNR